MKAINIVGYKNSGKTTLLLQLAQVLEAQGLSVACVKSIQKDAHTIFADKGTHNETTYYKNINDTERMCRQANPHTDKPRTVLTLGQDAAALVWAKKMDLDSILPLLSADILLMEGGKSCEFLPRILCLRHAQEAEEHAAELKPELTLATYSIDPIFLPPKEQTEGQTGGQAGEQTDGVCADSTHEQNAHARQKSAQQTVLQGRPHFEANKLNIQALAQRIQEQAFLLPRLSCGACGHKSCAAFAQALVKWEIDNSAIGQEDTLSSIKEAPLQKNIAKVDLEKKPVCAVLHSPLRLQVNGKCIALNPFTQRVLAGALGGIVSQLKGTDSSGHMEIQCDF